MLIVSLAISTSQAGFAEDAAGFPNGHREALGPLYGAAPDHRAGARGGRAIKRRKRNETPTITGCGAPEVLGTQSRSIRRLGRHFGSLNSTQAGARRARSKTETRRSQSPKRMDTRTNGGRFSVSHPMGYLFSVLPASYLFSASLPYSTDI